MASPATIPITILQQSSAAPVSSQSQSPIATSALRAFASGLSSSIRQSLSNRRPWSELFDRTAFSRPDSLSESSSRFRKNFSYFRVNYLSFLALILAVSLISHPLSLCLLASWIFLYLFRPADQPLVLLGRPFSDRETLCVLVLITVVVVFLTSVGSLLISAVLIGLALIAAHGAFRVPEDLFLDDPEPSSAGLLSFLGGAASSAAAAAALPVAGRV